MENTFYKLKKALVWILSRLSAILLTIMSILIIYQVFTRYILNNPADFTEEIIRYMLIWTGFIGAAYAFLTREHMALTLVPDRVKPGTRRNLLVFTDVIILLIALFVIVIGGFKLVASASVQRSALLGIPRSLVYVVAPISGIFIVLAQIINVWESWTGNSVKLNAAEESVGAKEADDYSLNPDLDDKTEINPVQKPTVEMVNRTENPTRTTTTTTKETKPSSTSTTSSEKTVYESDLD